jgi:glyoxylase-like metal-dependent hydrolase (beta-lactamase superfamily II)
MAGLCCKRILKYFTVLMALILFTAPSLAISANESFDGVLVNPDVVENSWKLPANAIDTRGIPDFKLDPGAADDKPLPVYRLTPNTYFMFGGIATLDENNRGWNGNAGFVVTDEGVVVIDSLGTPKLGKRLIATIASVTSKPIKYLIVTHNHPDHAYGAAAFRAIEGITIIAHRGTIDYNNSATLQQSVEYRESILPQDMQGFAPLQADNYIGGDTFSKKRITLGDAVFDIYNTGKHHSYGDLIVHQLNQHIMWLSDLAFNQRTTYMGDGHSAQILAAQDWLMAKSKQIELMVPGHGSAQKAPFPMVQKTHDYVTHMREAMRKAVENDVPLLEAVKNVEFENWQNTRLYKENQRANANFVYREMERAYFDNF